jgi:WD40 repeat protein
MADPEPRRHHVAALHPDTAAAITEPRIFQGGNVLLLDWSRNGRYLTYFEYTEEQIAVNPNYLGGAEGTFTIYDTTTGTKCQDYPLSGNYAYEGSGLGERHLWLPNGDLFLLTEQGDSFQIATPCQEQAVPLFAEPFQHIASLSPDESTLVLGGVTGYWLYNWQAQTSWAMDAEIPPSTYNSLAWSPDGRYLAITAVDYDRKPIGTTWMVETATGTILTRHDWQAMTALDGIFGSPVWLNNEEVLITMTEDGEPFFMTVTGEILPLLPLFPATDRDLPRAYVYVGSNSYHILLTEFGSATPPVQIYHSDTDQVETLATTTTDIYLGLDGQIIADRTDTDYLSRFITVADVPLMRVHPQCYPDDSVPPIGYYAKQMADQRIQIWHIPDCSLVASLNLGEAGAETNYFQTRFAPNNKWLAVVPFDNLGRGKTLFVLPLAEVLP